MDNKTVSTNEYGTTRHYLGRLLHRTDGPAIEYTNGDVEYCKDGKLRRIDGPAVEE